MVANKISSTLQSLSIASAHTVCSIIDSVTDNFMSVVFISIFLESYEELRAI